MNENNLPGFVWAKIPGCPRAMRWPVLLESRKDDGYVNVFCRSDDAEFRVREEDIETLHPVHHSTWELIGLKCLAKKKRTLACFLADIAWAKADKPSEQHENTSEPTETLQHIEDNPNPTQQVQAKQQSKQQSMDTPEPSADKPSEQHENTSEPTETLQHIEGISNPTQQVQAKQQSKQQSMDTSEPSADKPSEQHENTSEPTETLQHIEGISNPTQQVQAKQQSKQQSMDTSEPSADKPSEQHENTSEPTETLQHIEDNPNPTQQVQAKQQSKQQSMDTSEPSADKPSEQHENTSEPTETLQHIEGISNPTQQVQAKQQSKQQSMDTSEPSADKPSEQHENTSEPTETLQHIEGISNPTQQVQAKQQSKQQSMDTSEPSADKPSEQHQNTSEPTETLQHIEGISNPTQQVQAKQQSKQQSMDTSEPSADKPSEQHENTSEPTETLQHIEGISNPTQQVQAKQQSKQQSMDTSEPSADKPSEQHENTSEPTETLQHIEGISNPTQQVQAKQQSKQQSMDTSEPSADKPSEQHQNTSEPTETLQHIEGISNPTQQVQAKQQSKQQSMDTSEPSADKPSEQHENTSEPTETLQHIEGISNPTQQVQAKQQSKQQSMDTSEPSADKPSEQHENTSEPTETLQHIEGISNPTQQVQAKQQSKQQSMDTSEPSADKPSEQHENTSEPTETLQHIEGISNPTQQVQAKQQSKQQSMDTSEPSADKPSEQHENTSEPTETLQHIEDNPNPTQQVQAKQQSKQQSMDTPEPSADKPSKQHENTSEPTETLQHIEDNPNPTQQVQAKQQSKQQSMDTPEPSAGPMHKKQGQECFKSYKDCFIEEETFDDFAMDPDYCPETSDEETDEDLDYRKDEDGYISNSSDSSDIIPTQMAKMFPALNSIANSNCSSVNSTEQSVESEKSGKMAKVNSLKTNVKSNEKCERKNSDIVIQVSTNSGNKRVWDKLHFCFFCDASSTNISKHYLGPHKSEPEVQKILSCGKKTIARKHELLKLRNAGDFQHNMNVLKAGQGIFVTWARRFDEELVASDFLPCEDCLGFFLKSNLWRHKKVCPFKKQESNSRKVQSEASLLLPCSVQASKGLQTNVISRMNADEIAIAARNDRIIIKIGEKLYQKHGHLPHLYTHISQKMREMGRFLIAVRNLDQEVKELNDLLHPQKFLLAVKATRMLCNYCEDKNSYGNPSLALKIGHLLKKSAKIKKSTSLTQGDSINGKQADEFHTLVNDEWTDEISSSALQTLSANKMNKGQMLPLADDIRKLQCFFQEKTSTLSSTLQESFCKPEWETLNQMTLAWLVMFNRRRGGETQRITLDAYKTKMTKHDPLQEIEHSLSPVEKMLCSTFGRIEIRGKKGRTVPVLLTPVIMNNIDLLLKWREDAGVHRENPYLFARPNLESTFPIRSSDALRKFANDPELQLTLPGNITSTKLRKHVATVAQILNLEENDLETIANFMGHDIEVHRSFYRLPQDTLQVARMGKLLSAFDNGTIGNYSGKSLNDITVEDVEFTYRDEEDDIESDENDDSDEDDIQLDEIEQDEPATRKRTPEVPTGIACSRKRKLTTTESGKIQRLTDEESETLRRIFNVNVTFRRELKMHECLEAMAKNPCLKRLNWKKIKNTVHNWITLEKKKIAKLS